MFHPSNYLPDIEIGDEADVNALEASMKRLMAKSKRGAEHVCSPKCFQKVAAVKLKKTCNPFLVPLKCGFLRVALKQDPKRRQEDDQEEAFAELQYNEKGIKLVYVTPCGKVLYCMEHIRRYLNAVAHPILDVDDFTFSEGFILKKTIIKNALSYCPDVTSGQEDHPISALNQVDESSFKFDFLYVVQRRFFEPPPVNLLEFRVSCDCEGGDCGTVEACPCRQLTQTDNCGMTGYTYKRLMTKHDFGVYECNDSCKCSSKCLNRVMGNGIKVQLQIFATTRKGWGVRALHFIPKGTFVCAYNGQILNDDQANMVVKDHFLAALDHIEVAIDSAREAEKNSGSKQSRNEAVPLNLNRYQMFGQEHPYVVDGSRYTNVGRLFNHSCSPNMFIQNVFLETQDLRFSHLAFFTATDVSPMEELTWDYNWTAHRDDKSPVYCSCLDLRCTFRLR